VHRIARLLTNLVCQRTLQISRLCPRRSETEPHSHQCSNISRERQAHTSRPCELFSGSGCILPRTVVYICGSNAAISGQSKHRGLTRGQYEQARKSYGTLGMEDRRNRCCGGHLGTRVVGG